MPPSGEFFLVRQPRQRRILIKMKLFPLICAIWLVASCPSGAGEEKRFLEFPSGHDTTTFDLNTVQIIQPGRFTIISTTIDDPDVMKFELTVLYTLRDYCTRPDGKYPAPAELLTLGPADMPVKSVEVESHKKYQTRTVDWSYPYKRFALETTAGLIEGPMLPLFCESPKVNKSDVTRHISEGRSVITNGVRSKSLYDCKRGMVSLQIFGEDDSAKATMAGVPKGSRAFKYYLSVCWAVTHEVPTCPNKGTSPGYDGRR